MLCLFQNGERVRPSNGYPLRLLLPGFEGNMNVKWLRRLKLTRAPAMTKDETSKYTDPAQGRKSLAVRVSDGGEVGDHAAVAGHRAEGAGLLRDLRAGLVGQRQIRQVEVSADGGKSWAPAALSGPVLPKALTRFRAPWRWNGGPAVLQSRATDDTGMVQPTARAVRRGARAARRLSLQCDCELGHRRQGGGGQCLCVNASLLCAALSARAGSPPPRRAPQFGQPIAPADIAPWDISIGPDGAGLPPGSGTAKQGEAVYPRSARPATARRARASRTTRSSAATARSSPASRR